MSPAPELTKHPKLNSQPRPTHCQIMWLCCTDTRLSISSGWYCATDQEESLIITLITGLEEEEKETDTASGGGGWLSRTGWLAQFSHLSHILLYCNLTGVSAWLRANQSCHGCVPSNCLVWRRTISFGSGFYLCSLLTQSWLSVFYCTSTLFFYCLPLSWELSLSGTSFHLHTGWLELSQSDHWVLGHICYQEPFLQIAQLGWSPVFVKRTPFQNDEEPCALGNIQCCWHLQKF